MKGIKNKFAATISYLFHPLFMPFFSLLYFYFSNEISGFNFYTPVSRQHEINLFFVIIFICSFFIPASYALFLKKTGRINSLTMKTKKERTMPFLITATSILFSLVFVHTWLKLSLPPVIIVFHAGYFLAVLTAFMITLKWKISIHMIGVGGFTGAVFLLNNLPQMTNINTTLIVLSLLLSGLVGYSRLTLNAHSLLQVSMGFLLGFVSETFVLWL